MNSICIVTDNSAQFANASFRGQSIIKLVHLKPSFNGKSYKGKEKQLLASLPEYADARLDPHLRVPSVEEFRRLFSRLGKQYNEIIGIFLSSRLSNCIENASKANMTLRGGPKIHIIDSQTTSIGLGNMIQCAAETVFDGGSLTDVERAIRGLSHRTYLLLCTPNLSYLCSNKFVDHGQATVGEMLGILPIFAMEEGELVPVEKKRNPRHVIVHFQEFIDEFDEFDHIALVQSATLNGSDARSIRDHVNENFPGTPFTEHSISLPLAALFGPATTALIIVEKNDS